MSDETTTVGWLRIPLAYHLVEINHHQVTDQHSSITDKNTYARILFLRNTNNKEMFPDRTYVDLPYFFSFVIFLVKKSGTQET